ncbi:MAG: two-component system response regulator [Chloroflexi bacterium HGW-Chloroflexi-10]|nr:MAG: two-component system response regulator [Chloroflexi bacterium HGW-Chloroflexi-10]
MTAVLFVDDDANILNGLRRMLRSMRNECDVLFADSGAAALKIFSESTIDVLITDLRMPAMDGVKLLEEVSRKYPGTVRIILSGYADREISLRTIGLAHQFLSKPCDDAFLKNALRRAITQHHLASAPDLQKVVSQLHTLPSLPDLYYQIVSELNNPNASSRRVGEIVSRDMSMTARVLQLVNSSFFGIPTRVVDPVQATTMLGLETVRDLALSLHIFSQFNETLLAEMQLDTLWEHVLRVGAVTKMILKDLNMPPKRREAGFILGLLHDLGKLILAQNMSGPYQRVLEKSRSEGIPLHILEKDVFGASHSDIGAYLFGIWGLDEVVMIATAYHHEPRFYVGDYQYELAAVHIANSLVTEFERDKGVAAVDLPVDMDYLTNLGLAVQFETWRQSAWKLLKEGVKYA